MIDKSSISTYGSDGVDPTLGATSDKHLYIMPKVGSSESPLAVTLASGEHVLTETEVINNDTNARKIETAKAISEWNNIYILLYSVDIIIPGEEPSFSWCTYNVSKAGILDSNSRIEHLEITSYESVFGMDLDRDATIGAAPNYLDSLVTDTAGATLKTSGDINYLYINMQLVTFDNRQPVLMNTQFEDTNGKIITSTAIAVSDLYSDIFYLLFKMTESKDQTENVYYEIYSVSKGGILDPNSNVKFSVSEIKSQEIIFSQDLDGDNVINMSLSNGQNIVSQFTNAVTELNELHFENDGFVWKNGQGNKLDINKTTFIKEFFNIQGVCFTETAWIEIKKLIVQNLNRDET